MFKDLALVAGGVAAGILGGWWIWAKNPAVGARIAALELKVFGAIQTKV